MILPAKNISLHPVRWRSQFIAPSASSCQTFFLFARLFAATIPFPQNLLDSGSFLGKAPLPWEKLAGKLAVRIAKTPTGICFIVGDKCSIFLNRRNANDNGDFKERCLQDKRDKLWKKSIEMGISLKGGRFLNNLPATRVISFLSVFSTFLTLVGCWCQYGPKKTAERALRCRDGPIEIS